MAKRCHRKIRVTKRRHPAGGWKVKIGGKVFIRQMKSDAVYQAKAAARAGKRRGCSVSLRISKGR